MCVAALLTCCASFPVTPVKAAGADGVPTIVDSFGASEVKIAVTADPATHTVTVEVSDDGIGGADMSRGSGLRGLEDRAAAQCGTLAVTSPPGGGTTVRAVLPCV